MPLPKKDILTEIERENLDHFIKERKLGTENVAALMGLKRGTLQYFIDNGQGKTAKIAIVRAFLKKRGY